MPNRDISPPKTKQELVQREGCQAADYLKRLPMSDSSMIGVDNVTMYEVFGDCPYVRLLLYIYIYCFLGFHVR